jgi:ABC-type sugar transport system permease subunit
MLSPTLFFAAVVGSIMAFQAFGQIDLLTEGGPNNETNVLVYSIYKDVFRFGNDGVAAVKAIALFLIVFVLTVVQLRIARRRVTYER